MKKSDRVVRTRDYRERNETLGTPIKLLTQEYVRVFLIGEISRGLERTLEIKFKGRRVKSSEDNGKPVENLALTLIRSIVEEYQIAETAHEEFMRYSRDSRFAPTINNFHEKYFPEVKERFLTLVIELYGESLK